MTFTEYHRVAAITGGATGIGAATVLRLIDEGFDGVVIGYRTSASDAEAVADTVRRRGGAALVVPVDVSDEASVRNFADACAERFGRCDAVVNSAGITRWIDLTDLDAVTDDDWMTIFTVNTVGSFRVARAFRALLDTTAGVVVNVASAAAHVGAGSSMPYAVSKAAVVRLTQQLAIAMAPNIRVVSVSPGTVDTPWHNKRLDTGTIETYYSAVRNETALSRVTEANDVADAIAWLVQSRAITGIDVLIDGGKHVCADMDLFG
ncbi:SDR family NAD(P)-dependent oxidoreductase [Microbacterium sp. YY-01]|uniref:SDR family NAD(P)-dependent oxidoreductase n=1 Tax=Microbacterium sp. YY-01 TaxID=3421634 RepID=UPI003D175020